MEKNYFTIFSYCKRALRDLKAVSVKMIAYVLYQRWHIDSSCSSTISYYSSITILLRDAAAVISSYNDDIVEKKLLFDISKSGGIHR